MQKKVTIISGVLAVIVTIFAWCAWDNTHGIKLYMVSYEMGQFFNYTCLPAIVVAIVLWGILVVLAYRVWKEYRKNKVDKPKTEQEIKPVEKKKREKLCTKCGAVLDEKAKFCNKCGNAVE